MSNAPNVLQVNELPEKSSINEGVGVVEPYKLTTTRKELWSYYTYFIGNNGLSGLNFGPSQFQNLLFRSGYDPTQEPFMAPCSTNGCVLPYLGQVRDINSAVLLTNGISFAFQAIIMIGIGAWADYGQWRPNVTIFFTFLAIGVAFGWLGVERPEQWPTGVALYILGLISYQCSITFCAAAFPGLARDLPDVQESLSQVGLGQKHIQDHAKLVSMSRNRISNMLFAISSLAEIAILAVMIGILKALNSDQSTENNTKAFSVIIAFSGGVWLLCALPWFLFEQRRPGLALPPSTSFLTIGLTQIYVALKECTKLKQTFLYLIFYFLMGDVLNTTVTVVATLQNSVVAYSTLQLTLLLTAGIGAQTIGVYSFWLVQKRFQISTKAMLLFIVFWIMILTVWGLIGVHTDRFGFKHAWEFWLYQVFYGMMVCPWYSYSLTMITEVSPLPQMFLFFALFSVVGKTSAFIGPLVSSAIISASGNNKNMPFAFLFGLGAFSVVFLWLVDVDKSRAECQKFVMAEENREAFKVSD